MNILSVPHELTESERQDIEAHIGGLISSGKGFSRFCEYNLPGRPNLFIKFCGDNLAEASTQHFFYCCAKNDESAPQIPRIFDAFCVDKGGPVIVMEKLEALTLADSDISDEEAVKYAAFAVDWLFKQLPLVPGTCFGRIFSQEFAVWHNFFKDQESPKGFANPEDLAEYVSRGSHRIRDVSRHVSAEETIASFGDHRCVYHSDIRKSNFLLDSSNRVCIIDFQHVGVLPEVFQTYALFNVREPFAHAVGRELGYQPSKAARDMMEISGVL